MKTIVGMTGLIATTNLVTGRAADAARHAATSRDRAEVRAVLAVPAAIKIVDLGVIAP